MIRVAIVNRDRHSHPGGDLIQIDYTIAALARIDVEAVYLPHDCAAADIAQFDLAHLHHCQFGWCWRDWLKIRAAKKRYVVTPVFYPKHWEITKEQVETILAVAEKVLPFSKGELDEIHEAMNGRLDLKHSHRFIPNGTDPAFHAPNAGPEREGVLCVSARGDNDKNTDRVDHICKDIGLPFMLATGIPHEQMPEVYKRHRVFVNASDSERMSLTIGEALCAGCRVLATKHNRGNEWYPGIVTFDPDGWNSALLHDSHEGESWDFTPNDAARRMTWDATAAMLKRVYRDVLA